MAGRIYDIIDSLNISRDWKLTFKKIHISYYNNYSQGKKALYPVFWKKSSEVAGLPFPIGLQLYCWFNPYGLIFGPFYYLINGLYMKGSILTAIFLALLAINDITRFMSIFILIYCAFFINVDFFEEKVLNHPEVKSNPLMIANDFDSNILEKLLAKRTSPVPYILLLIVLLAPVAWGITKTKQDSEALKHLISEPKKVCKDKNECIKLILGYMRKINATNNSKDISREYYNIALAYYSLNDFINTIKSLDNSVSFDKNNVNSYLLRAKSYNKMNNNIQALLDYKEALKLNPKATFLNYYIGFNYYALGKYDRALEYFEKATRVHNDPSYFEAQAYTRKMLNDKQGAIKDIKKAITLYNKAQNTDKVKKLGDYLKGLEK